MKRPPVVMETLIHSSARLPALFVNDCVTVSRRSPAAPSSHFLVIRKKLSAIAQTHLISVSLTYTGDVVKLVPYNPAFPFNSWNRSAAAAWM